MRVPSVSLVGFGTYRQARPGRQSESSSHGYRQRGCVVVVSVVQMKSFVLGSVGSSQSWKICAAAPPRPPAPPRPAPPPAPPPPATPPPVPPAPPMPAAPLVPPATLTRHGDWLERTISSR